MRQTRAEMNQADCHGMHAEQSRGEIHIRIDERMHTCTSHYKAMFTARQREAVAHSAGALQVSTTLLQWCPAT